MGRLRRARTSLLLMLAALVLVGCLPSAPATGRSTPVRRVLVLGDSMSWGLFGLSPRLHEPLGRAMSGRRIEVAISGAPGDTPLDPWPGSPTWVDRLRHDVATFDPDVVVLQSTLLAGAEDPARQAAYRATFAELFDIAQSRGAHVYTVAHPTPPGGGELAVRDVVQRLQAEAATGRGISTIPLDWWLARCRGGTITDGWHLSDAGQGCHALAITLAVDQLRRQVG